jgi:hypothetical protein
METEDNAPLGELLRADLRFFCGGERNSPLMLSDSSAATRRWRGQA